MSNWLHVYAGSGDAFIDADLSTFPLGNGVSIDMDVYTTSASVAAIGTSNDSADWFRIFGSASNLGGVFGVGAAGPSLIQWNDFTPNSPNGTIPQDTVFHVNYVLTYNSGTLFDVVVKIDGTTVDTFTFDVDVDNTEQLSFIRVGAALTGPLTGEEWWMSNLVVKDEFGSSIFSEDFSTVSFPGSPGPWSPSGFTDNIEIVANAGDNPGAGHGGGGGGSVPGGDDCASATDLGTTTSGTVSDDNSTWAGTWPTGADPLFNDLGGTHGGGAPKWWKVTNTFGVPKDFQIKKLHGGIDINAAVMVGSCGALSPIPNKAGITTNGSQSDWELGDNEVLDVVVQPGETVYIEVDSWYSSSPTEPPDPTGHQGLFSFQWAWTTVTFYDGIPTSELLADGFLTSDLDPPFISVIDSLQIGSIYYLLFELDTSTGPELWGGQINADGTSPSFAKISDYSYTGITGWAGSTGFIQIYTNNDSGPMLCSDGTRVWVGFFERSNGNAINWHDSSWTEQWFCVGHPITETHEFRTQQKINAYRGRIYEWSGSAWTLWQTMDQDWFTNGPTFISGDHFRGPEARDPGASTEVDYFVAKFTADAADPDYVHVIASYGGCSQTIISYSNNFPVCNLLGTDRGSLEASWSSRDVYEYIDYWRITDGQGSGATTVLTSDGTIPADGDTVTLPYQTPGFPVAYVTYTFKTALSSGPTVPNEILIGGSAANALSNLKKAINGTGTIGTDYSKQTFKNQAISADALTSTTLAFSVRGVGAAPNAFSTSETSAHLSFTGSTFAGGVDPGVPLATILASNIVNIESVSGYNPNLNPIFDVSGARFTITPGPWETGAQPVASIGVNAMWMENVSGLPLLLVNPIDSIQEFVTNIRNTIEWWEHDLTVIQTNAIDDYAPGVAITGSPGAGIAKLFFSPIFHNSSTAQDERFVSLFAVGTTPDVGIARIISTVDADPIPIDAGNTPTSDTEAFGRSWFCDTPRNYWGIPSTHRTVDNYDLLCNHAWLAGWREAEDTNLTTFFDFPRTFAQTQRGWWNSGEPPFVVLLNQYGELRKYQVVRDCFICTVGGLPFCPPSIFWFYRDGQWRQQNVDTEHSLWVYHDGAWTKDCKELAGRLNELWQN